MFEELATKKKEKQQTDESFFDKETTKKKSFVCFLYGDTSSGKTFVALSFPKPIYIIDTESRADSTKYYHYKNNPEIRIETPVQIKTDFDSKDVDILDTYGTIERITRIIIWYVNQVRAGKIDKGTFVIDSVTDFWSFCQDWGIQELAKYVNKQGVKRADPVTMSIEQQTDWRIINKKHHELIGLLRELKKYGIYVVFTAREEKTPEWVKRQQVGTKDKIRCQKDVPFMADVNFNLMRQEGETTKYLAKCIKLISLPAPDATIENLNFTKIQQIIREAEERVGIEINESPKKVLVATEIF